jgi:hypothetical protein
VTAFVIECEHHLARLLEADGSLADSRTKPGQGFTSAGPRASMSEMKVVALFAVFAGAALTD